MEPSLIKPTRKQQKHPLNLSLHVRRLSQAELWNSIHKLSQPRYSYNIITVYKYDGIVHYSSGLSLFTKQMGIIFQSKTLD